MIDLPEAKGSQARPPTRFAGSVGDWVCAIVLCLVLIAGLGVIVAGTVLGFGGVGGRCGGG
ncbi:MAG TPA: hypothetical protein VKY26_03440 [Actinomycetota bacterium]|nr:hypothetical protein [Actinomycetota bacterium]